MFVYDAVVYDECESGDGEIVYSGNLSNIGNVIMIDHGKDLRSVILGELEITQKVNDKIKQGQVLGYTSLKKSKKGKVYFELRYKNKIQKNIKWIN